MKKKSLELKTLKFFIVCSPPLRGPAFQASVFQASALAPAPTPTSHRFTKFSFAARTSYRSFISFERRFEPN